MSKDDSFTEDNHISCTTNSDISCPENTDRKGGSFLRSAAAGSLVGAVGSALILLSLYFLAEYLVNPRSFRGDLIVRDALAMKLFVVVYCSLFPILGWAVGKVISHYGNCDVNLYGYVGALITFAAFCFCNSTPFFSFWQESFPSGVVPQIYLDMTAINFLYILIRTAVLLAVVYCGYRFAVRPSKGEESGDVCKPRFFTALFFGIVAALIVAFPFGIVRFLIQTNMPTARRIIISIWHVLRDLSQIIEAIGAICIALVIRLVAGGNQKKFAYMGAALSFFAYETASFYSTLLRYFPAEHQINKILSGDFSYFMTIFESYFLPSKHFFPHVVPVVWVVGAGYIAYRVALQPPPGRSNSVFPLSSGEKRCFVVYLALVISFLAVAIDVQEPEGNALLDTAARSGVKKLAIEAFSKGAEIEYKFSHGHTALENAVSLNHLEIVDFLLMKGAGKGGSTKPSTRSKLFQNAVYNRNIEIIKIFIKNGINVNEKDRYGDTALMNVIADNGKPPPNSPPDFSDKELIKFFLEKGADVNIKNKKGDSALSLAEENGNPEYVKILEAFIGR